MTTTRWVVRTVDNARPQDTIDTIPMTRRDAERTKEAWQRRAMLRGLNLSYELHAVEVDDVRSA
jgi:hypothetical protein